MTNNTLKIATLTALLLSCVFMTGCNKKDTTNQVTEPTQQTEAVNYVVPYSKGPDGPITVKGPTAPPPQAVTEKEQGNFTLPLDR